MKALLLIAHGSRRAEANADLVHLAETLRQQGTFEIVEPSYLEISPPSILEGGASCVTQGATSVTLLPYFLSPGVHAHDDMIAARGELAVRFPEVVFRVAAPLGRHPLLAQIVVERAAEVEN